jgi:hypothetical protein
LVGSSGSTAPASPAGYLVNVNYKKEKMDVSIGGVIFIWAAFFWPLIITTAFTVIKGKCIAKKGLFFVSSTVACYVIGILMNFIFPAYWVDAIERIFQLLGVTNIKFTMNAVTIIMFGIHIFITYIVFLSFRTQPKILND